MEEHAKKYIHAFPQPKWIDTISCDGKPCAGKGNSCGSGKSSGGYCKSDTCGDRPGCDFAEMLAWFSVKYHDEVELKIADYSSLQSIERSLEDLNRILEANSEDLRVSLENLELVFSQIAPIVAINGTLVFVGKTPTEQDLVEALGIALH